MFYFYSPENVRKPLLFLRFWEYRNETLAWNEFMLLTLNYFINY